MLNFLLHYIYLAVLVTCYFADVDYQSKFNQQIHDDVLLLIYQLWVRG